MKKVLSLLHRKVCVPLRYCYRYREALCVMVLYNNKKSIKYSLSPLLALWQQHEMTTPSFPLTLYLCYSVPLFSLTMRLHIVIYPHLHISCSAAEGVAEECIS